MPEVVRVRARHWTLIALAASLLTAAALAACCARSTVEWIPEGSPITLAEAEEMARTADISLASGIEVSKAPEARRDVLVWLREQGPEGDRAASLLTTGFPERTASVPVRVEIALVQGTRSLVVVEAYGGPSGKLTYRRLWVFQWETGRLVRSASFR